MIASFTVAVPEASNYTRPRLSRAELEVQRRDRRRCRRRTFSAVETQALEIFKRGASLPEVAKALGCDLESADEWLSDPQPFRF